MSKGVRIILVAALTIAAGTAAAETIGPTDAKGLQDAVNRLRPGDTLTLTAGHYDLTGVVALPNHAVTITQDRVTIRGEGAVLCGPRPKERGACGPFPAKERGKWTAGLFLYGTDSAEIEGLAIVGFTVGISVGMAFETRGTLTAPGLSTAPGLDFSRSPSYLPEAIAPAKDTRVSHCEFQDSLDAIDVLGADGFTASENLISDVEFGIVVDGQFGGLGLTPIVLSRNEVRNSVWTGLHLQLVNHTPVTLTGNIVDGQRNPETPKFAGIRIRDALVTATVEDNVLTGATRGFLGHNNADLRFTNNKISGSRCSAVVMAFIPFEPSFLPGSTAVLERNVIVDNLYGAAVRESGYQLGQTLFFDGTNEVHGNFIDGIVHHETFGPVVNEDTCGPLSML